MFVCNGTRKVAPLCASCKTPLDDDDASFQCKEYCVSICEDCARHNDNTTYCDNCSTKYQCFICGHWASPDDEWFERLTQCDECSKMVCGQHSVCAFGKRKCEECFEWLRISYWVLGYPCTAIPVVWKSWLMLFQITFCFGVPFAFANKLSLGSKFPFPKW